MFTDQYGFKKRISKLIRLSPQNFIVLIVIFLSFCFPLMPNPYYEGLNCDCICDKFQETMAQGEKINFSVSEKCEKKWKTHFLELQVSKVISWTLYQPRTSGLAYYTHYNQYLTILHHPWLRVKTKLFSREKIVKKLISSFFGTPSYTSNFSNHI